MGEIYQKHGNEGFRKITSQSTQQGFLLPQNYSEHAAVGQGKSFQPEGSSFTDRSPTEADRPRLGGFSIRNRTAAGWLRRNRVSGDRIPQPHEHGLFQRPGEAGQLINADSTWRLLTQMNLWGRAISFLNHLPSFLEISIILTLVKGRNRSLDFFLNRP
jgi:hypothetical protein